MMHQVRYYRRLISPSYFRRGVRGWWIRLLNRFRFWIEMKVCYHVTKYLAKEDGLNKSTVGAFVREFKKDVKEERKLLAPRKEILVQSSYLDSADPVTSRRVRPSRQSTEEAIARLLAGVKRESRYTRGPNGIRIADPDGDFEALSETAELEVSNVRGEAPRRPIRRSRGQAKAAPPFDGEIRGVEAAIQRKR